MEAALWDTGVCRKLLERNTRNEALRMVGVYLGEALAVIGPSYLGLIARKERMKVGGFINDGDLGREGNAGGEEGTRMQLHVGGRDGNMGGGGADGGEGTSMAVNEVDVLGPDRPASERREIQNNNLFRKGKHLASPKPPNINGSARITDAEVAAGEIALSPSAIVTADEVTRVQKALRCSTQELKAAVKGPLPDALKVAGNLLTENSEIARKMMNLEPLMQNQNGEDLVGCRASANCGKEAEVCYVCNASDDHAAEPLVEKQNERDMDASNSLGNQNCKPAHQNHKGKGVDTMDPSDNQDKVGNVEIASCSSQNNVPKRSLMERNGTACTFEWDDSTDGLAAEAANHTNRFCLFNLRRKAVSPLKKYEPAEFVKRRKMKQWSAEEEDALREAVKEFGAGQWKLILNSRRGEFLDRNEVDLKDKWRNMRKYG